MKEWTNPMDWAVIILLALAWVLFNVLRPIKDYYVVRRLYFDRLHEHPWRGKQFAAHYHGFADYLAARAVFDRLEGSSMIVLDDARQEAEHSVLMVPARSKAAAIARIIGGKARDAELLHQTPYADVVKRRSFWQQEAKVAAAYAAEQNET